MLSNLGTPLTVSRLLMSPYFQSHPPPPPGSALFWPYFLLLSTLPEPYLLSFPQHPIIRRHCLLKHQPPRCCPQVLRKGDLWGKGSVLQSQGCTYGAGEGLQIPAPACLDLVCRLKAMEALHSHTSVLHVSTLTEAKSGAVCSTKADWMYAPWVIKCAPIGNSEN